MVAGEPMRGHGPVQSVLLKGIRGPEGSVVRCGVADQPLRPGEVDHRFWGSGWSRWGRWLRGWEGI